MFFKDNGMQSDINSKKGEIWEPHKYVEIIHE